MGLLRSLLMAQIIAPISGTLWVARKVTEAAEAQLYDPSAIRRALGDLERAVEAGDIDELTYDSAEEVLLARLREATRREQ